MEIVSIFVIVNNSLYSVVYDNEDESAFEALFSRWQDVEYLEQFFEDNKTDLESGFYGNITIEEAVLQTLDESGRFEQKILNSAKKGISDPSEVLEGVIFTPLHKNVYAYKHIESKAHGPNNKSWLRVYAIRIAPNLYVVSGGSIKLTKAMTSDHLKRELRKLEVTIAFLKEIGLEVEEDLGYIEIGNDDTD